MEDKIKIIELYKQGYSFEYIEYYDKNRNTTKETLYATRGSIYDKNNEVLAETVDSYTVVAYLDSSRSNNSTKPKHVIDKRETAKKLAPLINMSEDRIYSLLDQSGLYQVELGPGGRGLTELQKDAIKKLDLPGIDFISTSKRYYPNLDFASYILGYVTTDDNGNTNLHNAVLKDSKEFVRYFLEKNIDPNIQNNDGDTALHYAMRMNNIDIIRMLLNYGGNISIRNNDNIRPYDIAEYPIKKRFKLEAMMIALGGNI